MPYFLWDSVVCLRGEGDKKLKSNKQHLRDLKAAATDDMPDSAFVEQVPPFLRWAGSKRQLLPKLRCYWNSSYKRYVEPFAGSACLFFSIAPSRALLGDINKSLIETLATVRDDVEAVIPLLANARRDKDLYYLIRSLDPRKLSGAERAAQFIYLNRYCFNGLYRTNSQGRFNVPFGAAGTGHLPTPEHLRYCSHLLQRAVLRGVDFEILLSEAEPGDLVYIDPPYITSSRRTFSEYDQNQFTDADIRRLRECLERLSSKGISFIVSYAACQEAQYLADGFHVERAVVRRSIAGFAAKRVQRQELLISPRRPRSHRKVC